jgi:hypothetical protein
MAKMPKISQSFHAFFIFMINHCHTKKIRPKKTFKPTRIYCLNMATLALETIPILVLAGLNLPSGAEPLLHNELLVPSRLSPWFDIFNQNLQVPSTCGPHTLYSTGPVYLC